MSYNIIPATLAGRCANGCERDQGRVVHALPNNGRNDVDCYALSLCGKTHGARSAGWVPRLDLEINCARCKERFEKYSKIDKKLTEIFA